MNGLEMFLFGMHPEFVTYFRGRRHIWIEQMDIAKNTKAVQQWIDEDEKDKANRLNFVLHHIKETQGDGGFTWFFNEKSFT